MYKIIFCIDFFDKNAGASIALKSIIQYDNLLEDYVVLVNRIGIIDSTLKILKISNSDDIENIIKNGNYNFIHYFKSTGYNIFNWIIKANRKFMIKLPIITTICQQPTIPNLLLSSKEIKYSNLLVFIDKTSFNANILEFIPLNKKRMTYLGHSEFDISYTADLIKRTPKSDWETITFGRGSTLNKCHNKFIDIYNAIPYDKKRFIIAGIKNPEQLNIAQDDIKIVGVLQYNDWLELCNTFDIFLYILPREAYSSIDGTLGHAMLLKKPVIYFGPDAPKERIKNGINGFIANNIDDIPELCMKLINDQNLAISMGEEARKSTLNDFCLSDTIENYHKFYEDLKLENFKTDFSIPIKYKYLFIRKNFKRILRSNIKSIVKKLRP